MKDSEWKLDKTKFHLDSPQNQINTSTYDTTIGNNFRAAYAYNNVREGDYVALCSDLMMRFYVQSSANQGLIGINLSKYQTAYKAWVDLSGKMVIAKVSEEGNEIILTDKTIEETDISKPTLVKFANVDHQLVFQFAEEKLTFDLGRLPDDAGPRKNEIHPQAAFFGAGKLTLSHIALFRDIHYTSIDGPAPGRATEGNPFTLEKDQFFVLGDNSPNSMDSRWWNQFGIGNNTVYPKGIVPREYLVGKAFFVYWPGGFKPFANSRFALIPNIGRMKLIYGGSNKSVDDDS